MADNATLNAGSGGITLRTDELADTSHVQYVKLMDGTADSTAALPGDATNGLTVNLGANNDVTVTGTVTVDGSGVTQPVSDAGGSLTVDNSTLAVVGGGAEATALRVTLANDSTGVVSVDDNGGSLTVDGTVAVSGTVTVDGSGVTQPVSDAGGSLTVDATVNNTVSTNNSSTTPLGSSGVYTGTGEDVSNYAQVSVFVFADQNGTLSAQFSSDNSNWDHSENFTITASTAKTFQLMTEAQFFRLVYTNGASAQSAFRLESILKTIPSTSEIQHLDVAVADGSDAQLVRAVIAGKKPDTTYTNIQSTAAGNLKVSVQEFSDGVDVGNGTVGTETLRVTVASDSTGVLSVDDNGGTLTVDDGGTTLSVDDGAGSLTVDGTVSISGTVTVDGSGVTQPVSDAGGSLTVDGTVAVSSLPASTNTLEVVGDVAHDAAAAGNPVLVAASSETMADSAPANRVSADADAIRLSATDGALYVIPTGPQTWSYHVNGSAALTDASVHAAPGAGLSLYVTDIIFSSGAATAINAFFEEGASTVLGPYYLEATAGRGMAIHFGTPKKITANTALTITTSAAIAHSVDVTGFIAPG